MIQTLEDEPNERGGSALHREFLLKIGASLASSEGFLSDLYFPETSLQIRDRMYLIPVVAVYMC